MASLALHPDKSVVDVGCHWGACSSAQCPPAGNLKFGPSLDSWGQKAHRRIPLQGIDGPHKHTAKRTAAKSSQSLAQAYGKPGVSLGREQVGATSPTSSHQAMLSPRSGTPGLPSTGRLPKVLRAASVRPAAGLGTGVGLIITGLGRNCVWHVTSRQTCSIKLRQVAQVRAIWGGPQGPQKDSSENPGILWR